MKKIMSLTVFAFLLSASLAFAADGTTMVSGTPTIETISIYGGNSLANANLAANPLIKLSTKVAGVVRWTVAADGANSPSYAIGTKHTSGSRIFGTAYNATTVYFLLNASGTTLTGATFGTKDTAENFIGGGWTAY